MIPLCRNPVWWIHDYPADIQEKYFENHERIPTKTLSVPVLLKKGFALLLCAAVFVGLALLAGAKGFKTAFPASYGFGLGWTGTTVSFWTGYCLPMSSASVCLEQSKWTCPIIRKNIM
jgi:hypothetical protein